MSLKNEPRQRHDKIKLVALDYLHLCICLNNLYSMKKHLTEILKLTIAITLAIKLVDCMEVFICKMILM